MISSVDFQKEIRLYSSEYGILTIANEEMFLSEILTLDSVRQERSWKSEV